MTQHSFASVFAAAPISSCSCTTPRTARDPKADASKLFEAPKQKGGESAH
jgi:hypothetical protein